MEETGRLGILIDCLRKRGVSLDQTELQVTLQEGHGTFIFDWIDEYLGPETLLTMDEYDLFKKLESSGQAEAFESSSTSNAFHNRSIDDQELQVAIEMLQKSTTMIEKHISLLRVQQDTMNALRKANGQHLGARATYESAQHKMWTTEFTHTNSSIEESIQNLIFQITVIEESSKVAETNLRKTASDVLRADDKFLTILQALASDKISERNEEDDAVQTVRDLCARLIKNTVEGMRTRLDRLYLEAISSGGYSPCSLANEHAAEIRALQEELESLYTEILPVAQMSAEQQYLEKATSIIATLNAQERRRLTNAITFVSTSLSVLVHRLQHLTTQIEDYQNYRATAQCMVDFTRMELGLNLPTSPTAFKSDSTSRVQRLYKQTSPVRPRNTRRRSSVILLEDENNTEQQLLRTCGISIPVELRVDSSVVANLNTTLQDRRNKLHGRAQNLQESSETSIACHLHDAQLTFRLLRRSLMSETQFNRRQISNSKIDDALAKAELETEAVKLASGKVNLQKLREQNVRKEELVERWR